MVCKGLPRWGSLKPASNWRLERGRETCLFLSELLNRLFHTRCCFAGLGGMFWEQSSSYQLHSEAGQKAWLNKCWGLREIKHINSLNLGRKITDSLSLIHSGCGTQCWLKSKTLYQRHKHPAFMFVCFLADGLLFWPLMSCFFGIRMRPDWDESWGCSFFPFVTGSRGKGASPSDLLLLLNRSLDLRVLAAGRYISTSAKTRMRSASRSMMCSISSKKVRARKQRDADWWDRLKVFHDVFLYRFSPQTRQAGGRAESEERKVSSRVTMWKRFDENLANVSVFAHKQM